MISSNFRPGQVGFEQMTAQLYRDARGLADELLLANDHTAQGIYVPHLRHDVNDARHLRIFPGGAVLSMRRDGIRHRVDTSGVDAGRYLELRKDWSEGGSLNMFTGLSSVPESHELFYPHEHPTFTNVAANVVAAARAVVPHALSMARSVAAT